MQKTLLLLFLTVAGCNDASSSANGKPGTGGNSALPPSTTTPDSGGAAGAVNGGASGGTIGTAIGGTTGPTSGGTGGTTSVETNHVGTGGAATPGRGGTTGASTGGVSGSGGRTTGSGGATGADAAATDADRKDAGAPPAGTGGTSGTGGNRGVGGATGAGGATTCIPAASPGQSGMNTGDACISCHSPDGRMSRLSFTAAGTLYASATGGSVISGATVTITGSDNKRVTMVTGRDGNFYTASVIAFPATVQVSKCPDTVAMVLPISAGDCNDCHGSSMRLHLP